MGARTYDLSVQSASAVLRGGEKGFAIGVERGKQRSKIRIAKNMLRENFPDDLISELTGLSVSESNKLKAAPSAT